MKMKSEGGFLIARMLKECEIEINPAQGRIMFVLWQNDGIPITELARRTSLEKSTLTSMLDRLEDAGYVARVASPDDRRKILIRRTVKDKAWQKIYIRVSQQMTKLFYAGFSKAEIDEFERYLKRIFDNLSAARVG